jgi:hypothetical protein
MAIKFDVFGNRSTLANAVLPVKQPPAAAARVKGSFALYSHGVSC